MGEETRARAFEPFFTTKDPEERSGLGLATAYGIVAQSGGHISVASTPGEGTIFTIHLPVADLTNRNRIAGLDGLLRSSTGNTVLIAEDNEGVRALTARVLTGAGYRVFEACDGVEALDELRSLPEPIDLLISDVMMPRMNGSELAAHFGRIQPGTPVLLISGYVDEDAVRRAFTSREAILAKPFTPEALLEQVAQLIGTPRA